METEVQEATRLGDPQLRLPPPLPTGVGQDETQKGERGETQDEPPQPPLHPPYPTPHPYAGIPPHSIILDGDRPGLGASGGADARDGDGGPCCRDGGTPPAPAPAPAAESAGSVSGDWAGGKSDAGSSGVDWGARDGGEAGVMSARPFVGASQLEW